MYVTCTLNINRVIHYWKWWFWILNRRLTHVLLDYFVFGNNLVTMESRGQHVNFDNFFQQVTENFTNLWIPNYSNEMDEEISHILERLSNWNDAPNQEKECNKRGMTDSCKVCDKNHLFKISFNFSWKGAELLLLHLSTVSNIRLLPLSSRILCEKTNLPALNVYFRRMMYFFCACALHSVFIFVNIVIKTLLLWIK